MERKITQRTRRKIDAV
jgi:transposase